MKNARAAGGLKIIGTERHESRRIDNQLRGRPDVRAIRENPDSISLEDDLMRLFGSERLMDVFTKLGVEEGEQIEHKMLLARLRRLRRRLRAITLVFVRTRF